MTKYVRNNNTISGRLHDEMVMMDIEQGKYFSLNQTATAIWELLEHPLTREEICRGLKEDFDIDDDKCAEEVQEHLDEMVRLSLIMIVG